MHWIVGNMLYAYHVVHVSLSKSMPISGSQFDMHQTNKVLGSLISDLNSFHTYRSKIMPPLTNAVSFVNDDTIEFVPLVKTRESWCQLLTDADLLRGEVEQFNTRVHQGQFVIHSLLFVRFDIWWQIGSRYLQ